MKKLLVGCLVVLVLLGVGAIVGTWYVARKVNQSFIQPMTSAVGDLAKVGEISKLESDIRNTATFTPPASGELTDAQLKRLAGVQGKIRATLGARFGEMRTKYKELFESKREGTIADVPALAAAYHDLASAWLEAKRAQVAALNEANLSLDEYRWIRGQAYAALGLPVMEIDIAKIVDNVNSGSAPSEPPTHMSGSIGPSGPEANQKLIAPMKKTLEDNAALAIFGL